MDFCMYASKPCFNPRCTKDNGQLHRFCTFHRSKANDSQRRWQRRHQTTTTNESKANEGQPQLSVARPAKQRRYHPNYFRDVSCYQRQEETDWLQSSTWLVNTELAEPSGTATSREELGHTESLSDEEISALLESITQVTADPLKVELGPYE